MPFLIGLLTNLLIGLVISGVATLISSAFAPKPKPAPGTEVDVGGDVPLSFLVGTVGIAGKLEYENTWGASGGTPNAYLTAVYSLGDLPGIACTGLYENGQTLTKAASGHTSQGYPVAERQDSSSDRLWWEFFDGTQVAADSFLTGKFSSDPNYPFTSDMIGLGIPYMRMTALVDSTVWNGDPAYLFQCQGIAFYDPTKDSTVGGSGTQRLATQSTWAFSDNPAVIVYNILLGIYYGSTWVWGGRFLRNSDGSINTTAVAHRLPYANWAAAINACNTAITLNAGGTEKQFRAGREIFTSEQPIDVITEFLTAANARISEQAGVYTIVVGDPGSAAATFTDADIVIGDTQQLEPFPSLDEVVNGATATYREPTQAWESKETAGYYNSTFQTADDGRRQLVDLQLNVVFSGTQAQRIIKAQVKDARRFVRHVITLTPKWGTYRPLDVLAWTSVRNGYSAKAFLVAGMTILPNGNALVALQEIDPTDHSWTPGTDEKALTFAPLIPIVPASQALAGFTVAPFTGTDGSGTARRPGIELDWTGALDDISGVRVQIRKAGDTLPFFDRLYPYDAASATQKIYIAGDPLLGNSNYEVRGEIVPASGRTATWSSWLSVTTPNVGLTFPDLSADVKANLKWISQSIADARKNLDAVALRIRDSNWNTAATFKTLQTTLAVQHDNDKAYFDNQVTVAIGYFNDGIDAVSSDITTLRLQVNDPLTGLPVTLDGLNALELTVTGQGATLTAVAISITALQASVGAVSAGGQFIMEAEASPGGGWSRIGMRSYASDGVTLGQAAFFLDAKTDGSSRIAMLAQNTVYADPSGNVYALFDAGGQFLNIASINAGSITVDKLTLADFSNLFLDQLLVNTANWANTATWTGSPTQAWSFVNNAQSSGQRSVRWVAASLTAVVGNNARYTNLTYMPVEGGKTYVFGGIVDHAASGTGGQSRYFLQWLDASFASISTVSGTAVLFTNATATAVADAAVAPSNAVYARLAPRVEATATTVTGTADFYSFYMRRAAASELIPSGAILNTHLGSNVVAQGNVTAGTVAYDLLAVGPTGLVQRVHMNDGAATDIQAKTQGSGTIASGSKQLVNWIDFSFASGDPPTLAGGFLDITINVVSTATSCTVTLELWGGGASSGSGGSVIDTIDTNTSSFSGGTNPSLKYYLGGVVPLLTAAAYELRLYCQTNGGTSSPHTRNSSVMSSGLSKK